MRLECVRVCVPWADCRVRVRPTWICSHEWTLLFVAFSLLLYFFLNSNKHGSRPWGQQQRWKQRPWVAKSLYRILKRAEYEMTRNARAKVKQRQPQLKQEKNVIRSKFVLWRQQMTFYCSARSRRQLNANVCEWADASSLSSLFSNCRHSSQAFPIFIRSIRQAITLQKNTSLLMWSAASYLISASVHCVKSTTNAFYWSKRSEVMWQIRNSTTTISKMMTTTATNMELNMKTSRPSRTRASQTLFVSLLFSFFVSNKCAALEFSIHSPHPSCMSDHSCSWMSVCEADLINDVILTASVTSWRTRTIHRVMRTVHRRTTTSV